MPNALLLGRVRGLRRAVPAGAAAGGGAAVADGARVRQRLLLPVPRLGAAVPAAGGPSARGGAAPGGGHAADARLLRDRLAQRRDRRRLRGA